MIDTQTVGEAFVKFLEEKGFGTFGNRSVLGRTAVKTLPMMRGLSL
jgi:hypothetical protein